MPRKRREPRNCPRCGTEHRKAGAYCGQVCANTRGTNAERNASISSWWNTEAGTEQRDQNAADARVRNRTGLTSPEDWWVWVDPAEGDDNPDDTAVWTEV